jgi:hypothetical protein
MGLGHVRGIATLELIAVLAVTLVMIALATSVYRTYSARSEVRKSLLAIAPVQALIAHAFEGTGVPPASGRDVPGLADALGAHRLMQPIVIEHGKIEIRFGSEAVAGLRGKTLRLTPLETTDGRVVWQCGDGLADLGLYPLGFVGGTNRATEVSTTIEARYLPDGCR